MTDTQITFVPWDELPNGPCLVWWRGLLQERNYEKKDGLLCIVDDCESSLRILDCKFLPHPIDAEPKMPWDDYFSRGPSDLYLCELDELKRIRIVCSWVEKFAKKYAALAAWILLKALDIPFTDQTRQEIIKRVNELQET